MGTIYIYYYIYTLDTYIIAVCINVYVIMFNVLACFDEYVRAEILITNSCSDTDRLWRALTLITNSYC